MLNSGHKDIYTVYKQCLQECSSKIICTIQHKCSVFQLFTDKLAHSILGCDSRVCELSVSQPWAHLLLGVHYITTPDHGLFWVLLWFIKWQSSRALVWGQESHRLRECCPGGWGDSVQRCLAVLWGGSGSVQHGLPGCARAFRSLLVGSSWLWPWASSLTLSSSTT